MGTSYAFLISLSVVATGYFLKRVGFLTEEDGRRLTKIILNLTLPALILRTITSIDLEVSYAFLPVICVVWSGAMIGVALLLFRKEDAASRGVLVIGSVGYNIGLFAYPIINAVWGVAGLQYLAMFDIGSAFTNFGISFVLAGVLSPRGSAGRKELSVRRFALLPLKSVPLMSYFVAIAINLSGLTLPRFLDDLLSVFAGANQLLVLLMMGVFLRFSLDGARLGKLLKAFGLRYVPGLVGGALLFLILPFPLLYRGVLMVALILPVSMAVIPFSVRFGFDERIAGALVNYSIAVSFLLMWGLVALVNTMG